MLALLLQAALAVAQGEESSAAMAREATAATVRPPQLIELVEAEYPATALSQRREGDVVLKLTIDASGQVTTAEIVQSADDELDQAARSAALRFRFSPAYRGEAAVASRILYSYRFRLPAAQVSEPLPVPPAKPAAVASRRSVEQAPLAAAPAAIEIQVQGRSRADELRESAEAVKVIEIEQAQRQAADLGEVLARSEGVGVRREGGLGSTTRFSLNGLVDDQVRFFLDGVPLEFAGYPFGIANVPVNLAQRVEIYRGVVPIRFGADALGGAVNLVTDEAVKGSSGSASYQVGSFGTYRLTLGARHLHEPSGFFTRLAGFFDYAQNDYAIDVEVPDARGRLSPARVHRFNDAYRASGGNIELGFVRQRWAKRLLLRAFMTDYEKELQHNAVMTVPYGEVSYGETTRGVSVHHDAHLGRGVTLDSIVGYTHTRATFLDVSACIYDWFGRCIGERGQPGETEARPHDRVYWTKSVFGRVGAAWRAAPQHKLSLSVAPTFLTRTGDERRQSAAEARDALTAQRDLLTLVSGLEYELDLFDDRLENIAFAKQYLQTVRSEEPRPGNFFRRHDRDSLRFGVGDRIRYRVVSWLYAKASYELATRLPRADETFGDAAVIHANLELEPERSHNANLGVSIDARELATGSYRAEVNGFLRDAEELIVLLGSDRFFSYQNVFGARSLGVEAGAGWTSPGDYLSLDGNITCLDFRNTSDQGTFGDFDGDRIPNRPYLFANGSAELALVNAGARDELRATWNARYVHEFFRGWESVGLLESKQVVPSQLVHSLALTFLARRALTVSSTLEIQNITDAATFDVFGVQRPGRAYYFKGTAEF
jgi:vitamin B12 transporter